MWRENYDLTLAEQAAHQAQWGKYNDFPPGWRRLTQKEFAQSHFFTFSPVLTEFRQMLHVMVNGGRVEQSMRDKPLVSARLYFMHDHTGYATVADYWGGKVTHYAFGCKGPHANHTKCKACGFEADYDSSD